MNVEPVEWKKRRAKFVVRDTTPAFANSLRRAILTDVPTFSIDSVEIYENFSVLYDEVLTLRLGLIPLSTPQDYEVGDEASLVIDIEAEQEEKTVHSSDLEPENPDVAPVDEDIPIVRLKPSQSLAAQCTARLKKGREHAKNQGAVSVGYGHLQKIEKTDNGKLDDDKIVRGVVETEDGLINMEDYNNKLSEVTENGEIKEIKDSFVFNVETDGSIPIERLIQNAADSLSDRAEELKQNIEI